jgi:hypothetical protein
MSVAALDVFVVLVGFSIAAGPALIVTLMDMGKERALKSVQAEAALAEAASTAHTTERELVNV